MAIQVKKPFPERLQRAVESWREYTKPMREYRKLMLKHYSNGWYGEPSERYSRSPQPINLIDRGVQIIAPFLVSHNPRVMINPRPGTNNRNMKSFSRTLELAMAHLFDEIKLAELTLRPVAIDSLFTMGITKTSTMHSHEVEIMGYLHDVGQPYCDRVDFEDYIGDVTARNDQEAKMEGNFYRLPEEYVKTSGLYKHYDRLNPDLLLYGSDDTSPETIAKSNVQERDYQELHPSVILIDLWLPREDLIITIPPQGQGDKIMRRVEWDGPESGPFDKLKFRYFPDSIIPIPPVYTWLDLNKAVNKIATKIRDEVDREKHIGVYDESDAEAAERIKSADSGDLVGVPGGKDTIDEITLGGAYSKDTYNFLQFLLTEYSKTGPNLDLTGGRTTMAQTLGQEQMMQANAARELDDMVYQMYEFTSSIAKKLAWFLWTDPLIVIPLIKRVAGIDLQVEYSEAAKEGDFFDYSFDIEPFSMMKMNPEMRYQRLMQLVAGYILPTAQIAAAQGTVLNVPELAKDFARYLGVTNLDDWYHQTVPQQAAMNPYQPLTGTPRQGITDGRQQSSAGSNFNNQLQQQSRAGGQSTKETG